MSGSNSSAPGSGAPAELSPLGLTVHSLVPPPVDAARIAAGRLKLLEAEERSLRAQLEALETEKAAMPPTAER